MSTRPEQAFVVYGSPLSKSLLTNTLYSTSLINRTLPSIRPRLSDHLGEVVQRRSYSLWIAQGGVMTPRDLQRVDSKSLLYLASHE
jgi:hypothetical protein